MPYIGTPAVDRFTSTKAASVFSGDGSTTAFTLDHAVGSDEDILVSVDGVIQEPSVAYAVSNGTTLTFTGAPSSNSGNNIFVYYLFRTVGTVGHPSNQALTATNGTLTGTLAVTGATTLSSDVTIGDASAADKKIVFDGNAQDFHIGLDDSADSLTIGLGSTLGTTSHMIFDANGHITKPLQSAFLVGKSSQQSNIAVGQDVAITFDTEHFDQNGDFSSNTFTAPVTGKYQLNALVRLSNLDSASDYYYLQVVTSNRAYLSAIIDPDFGQDATYWQLSTSILADLDANDTASMKIVQHSGTQQTDLEGAAEHGTTFSGYLVA
jgi:hypothetical protein